MIIKYVLEQAIKLVSIVIYNYTLNLITYFLADAGQSIVPYFDSTNITFNVKAPLGGLGFFHHTSSSDYAGFIRPFIYSLYLNYTEFFYIEDYE